MRMHLRCTVNGSNANVTWLSVHVAFSFMPPCDVLTLFLWGVLRRYGLSSYKLQSIVNWLLVSYTKSKCISLSAFGYAIHSEVLSKSLLLQFQSHTRVNVELSHSMTKSTKWPVRPAKSQISLGIRMNHLNFQWCSINNWFHTTAQTLYVGSLLIAPLSVFD